MLEFAAGLAADEKGLYTIVDFLTSSWFIMAVIVFLSIKVSGRTGLNGGIFRENITEGLLQSILQSMYIIFVRFITPAFPPLQD